ncbi:MAG: tripartite tricarboxylate transporter substrate-binding protein [Proteobacteria bacterium]|nr:tripartite tricarboxylate transporter substrate-binding protein [Pseudomonadota bacterium]
MKKSALLTAAFAMALPATVASTASADDFFTDKQLTMTIASRPGGGFNAYGRNLAKHIVKHIPGNPTMIVKNMPGAGGRKATAWLDKLAPNDGSNMLGTMPGSLVEPILGDPGRVKYKPLEFGYVGSASGFTTLCLLRTDHKAKSFADMMKMQVVFGGDQIGSTTHDHSNMMRNLAGANIKLVKGYSGSKTLVLAVQQKEIDGFCGYAWASLMSQAPHLVKDNIVRLVVQFGLDPHPAATKAGIPPVWDYVKDPKKLAALKLLASVQVFGRPYIVPAGVPKERLEVLRKAFDATMKDPAFLKDMKKSRLTVDPTGGERVQQLIHDIYTSDEETQKLARWAISKSE